MTDPRIAVLVLGHNDLANLQDVLRSSLSQSYSSFEVMYLDNASSDGSLEFVKTHFPGTRVIAFARNLGYAGAYVKVLDQVFADDFDGAVLLNSDAIVDPRWLEELVRSGFADPGIAFAQPKVFLRDGKGNDRANTFGNVIHFLGFGYCGHYGGEDGPEFDHDRPVTFASGASLLVKKGPYRAIGGMDEDFFAYMEDQDLGWRARMCGYRSVLSSRSIMWHKYVFSNSSGNRLKFCLLERNRLFFIYKNFSRRTILAILPAFLAMELGVLAHSLAKGYFLGKMRAYRDFVRNFTSLRKKRQATQRMRVVPDRELFPELESTISFREVDSPLLSAANVLLRLYYRAVSRAL